MKTFSREKNNNKNSIDNSKANRRKKCIVFVELLTSVK